MTERLYYQDSYLREFTARVVDISADNTTAYLDRTAFYPTSGGQPYDRGCLGGVPVIEVIDEGDRVAHVLANPLTTAAAAAAVDAAIDWKRRFDHMQQHSGQHLLSAVFEDVLGLRTVSFHLGPEVSTIDLETSSLENAALRQVELCANESVWENRRISVEYRNAADAGELRKPSAREGTLRIVTIEGLDRSACGGTHVRVTGEIGPILLRRVEKVRQTSRVEFVCGGRAIGRARSDYDGLAQIAKLFSAPLEETPALVASQWEMLRAAEKAQRKLELEVAAYRGRELYDASAPGPDDLRRYRHRAHEGSMEELRALAQNFTAQPKAAFLAVLENPASVLYAVSADAGIDAGAAVKRVLAEAGGRGGGSARLGQGSVPNAAMLEDVLQKLS